MIKALLKPFGTESFFIGLGVAAIVYLMGPQLEKSLKPAAVKGAQGMMALGLKTKELLDQGRDKVNEMVREAPAAAPVKQEDLLSLINEIKQDRLQYNAVLEELRNSVHSLRDEISGLKAAKNAEQA